MSGMVGATIGSYQIIESLGVGGMAEVYKAYHPGLEVHRALKFVRPEYSLAPDFRIRFQREARNVAQLRHPNIVQVYDFGEHEGRFYMVMEFVDGQTLKQLLAYQGAMHIDAAVALVKEVAGALDYAHQQGLIHRDIKPDNIMLDSRQRVVLMDFGIAKLVIGDSKVTATGSGIGTPAYMAPEQSRAQEVGPYTDVYSLSVVLFELLTGRTPFLADTPLSMILKSLSDPIPMPRTLLPEISEPLERVLIKGTTKEVSARYQTAGELIRALNATRGMTGQTSLPQSALETKRVGIHVPPSTDVGLALQAERHSKVDSAGGIPAKRRRWRLGVLVLVTVSLLLLLSNKLMRSNRTAIDSEPISTSPTSALVGTVAPVKISMQSIAVLPFSDLSEKKDQGFLADGLADDILNQLAQVPDLRVTARTSAFSFRSSSTTIPDIARQLGVTYLLEGSVRRAGDQLRVSVQLVQANTGFNLWSRTYDRQIQDVFKLQDDISNAVVQALQIKLSGGELRRKEGGTENLEAYQSYLKADLAVYENTKSSLEAARALANLATTLDPSYGLAFALEANAISLQVENGFTEAPEGYARAGELVRRSLQLSPRTVLAYIVLQIIRKNQLDWVAFDDATKNALSIDPTNPDALQLAALLSVARGNWEEAEDKLRIALTRDPLNPFVIWTLGMTYYGSGRFQEAETVFRKLLVMAPTFGWTRIYLSKTMMAQGKPDEALKILEKEPEQSFRLTLLPAILDQLGRRAESDEALAAQIEQWGNIDAYGIAGSYARRGDHETAVRWLERAYEQKSSALPEMLTEPVYRQAPYHGFLQKIGLKE